MSDVKSLSNEHWIRVVTSDGAVSVGVPISEYTINRYKNCVHVSIAGGIECSLLNWDIAA